MNLHRRSDFIFDRNAGWDARRAPTRDRHLGARAQAQSGRAAQAGEEPARDPRRTGRGGEEALALAQAEIPFEVVPGVSSLAAVPAAAGTRSPVAASPRRFAS
ncbi:MAG: SAM-dependent methyltransferase [Gaiellaceae bacterium]